MTITDDNKRQIRALAVLTCYAAANPPATYEWTDESTGEITKGAKVVINHSGNFTCNASNVIRGKTFHQSKLVYWQSMLLISTLCVCTLLSLLQDHFQVL